MTTKLIGNKQAHRYLFTAIEKGSLAHAYLITGLPGLGKASLVQMMVVELHHLTSVGELAADADFKLVQLEEGKKDISIEQVREVTEFVKLKSWAGLPRVVVIDDAASLNAQSANALLKTLEEPLGDAIIFLITSRPRLLLPTIKSRCQIINMHPVADEELKPWLSEIGVDSSKVPDYLGLSQGRPGQVLFWKKNPDFFIERHELAKRFLNFIASKEPLQLLEWVEENLSARGHKNEDEGEQKSSNANKALDILAIWLEITRDLILCKYNLSERVAYKSLAELQKTGNNLAIHKLLGIVQVLGQAQNKLSGNANARLTTEWIIISIKSLL